jgi:hypothetical protein
LFIATPAAAQYRQPPVRSYGEPLSHQLEITPFGGYMWTFARRVSIPPPANKTGDLDVDDSPFWGIEVDVTLHPGAQLALLYSRQDSDLTFKSSGIKNEISGVSVEYFQIGGLGGTKQGKALPFAMFTLGATRFDYKDVPQADDTWKFSIILGFGAKYYVNKRVGLRVQGLMPFTFVSGGGGFACGTGGCYTTVGGSGVAQINVSGGLIFMF